MHTGLVAPERIATQRLDPDYYRPQYLNDEDLLINVGSEPLDKAGKFFVGPFGSKLPSSLYLDEGIPLFRISNVGQMQVDTGGMAYLAPQVHAELSASKVLPGDLLIVKASVGEKICKVPDTISQANITQHIIALRPNGSIDIDYVSAILFCRYGRRQLMRRALGSVVQYLGVSDTKTVLLPKVSPLCQKYIGDKVRQADQLRARSIELEKKIQDAFSFLTRDLQHKKKAWRISGSKVEAYRLNSSHYDAVVLDMLEKADVSINLIRLGAVLGTRGLSGGATPKGADYSSKGTFFVRVQNVKPLRLDLSDAVYLSASQNRELKRSQCEAREIILTITGYPGTAAIVLKDDLPLNINQHSVRFDVSEEWEPEYIVAALNSKFIKLQVDRLAIGATREALDYKSVTSLLIPKLSAEIRKKITEWVKAYGICVRYSEHLSLAAKLLVESLVEGKLTEREIKNAQEDLERGNVKLDREVLTRLTRSEIDRRDEPPLFPSLDDLYSVLSLSDLERTRKGSESTEVTE